jgi:hypothetical protein
VCLGPHTFLNRQVCTKPRCGLNTSRASLKANLADILLDLGRKQKLSKSPDIRFRNRTTDDLPTEIQGKAFWLESRTEGRSAYHLREGLYTYPVEYINGTWYRISWTIDQCYEVSREDKIEDPQKSGLGTKSQPFLFAPDVTVPSTLGLPPLDRRRYQPRGQPNGVRRP